MLLLERAHSASMEPCGIPIDPFEDLRRIRTDDQDWAWPQYIVPNAGSSMPMAKEPHSIACHDAFDASSNLDSSMDPRGIPCDPFEDLKRIRTDDQDWAWPQYIVASDLNMPPPDVHQSVLRPADAPSSLDARDDADITPTLEQVQHSSAGFNGWPGMSEECVRMDEKVLHSRSKAPPLPDPIHQAVQDDGRILVTWKIPGKTLVGKDPDVKKRFELNLPNRETLEVMLILEAQPIGHGRGAKSFAKCKAGKVLLKCLDNSLGETVELTSRIKMTSGRYADSEYFGPVKHEIGTKPICRLGGNDAYWNLPDAMEDVIDEVGDTTKRVSVSVELAFANIERAKDNSAIGGA